MKKKSFLFLLLILIVTTLSSCKEEVVVEKIPEVYSISGNTMGTTYSIKIVKNDSTISENVYKKLKNNIDELLVTVNREMSTYIVDSEISRFNDYQDTNWFPISTDFAFVVKRALKIGTETDSTLDITVGALVNLWGFGPQKRAEQVPDSLEIQSLQSNIGINKIQVRLKPASIKKVVASISIDLSAIAKGFGVDKVSNYLLSIGVSNYMVEIGGEVRAKGHNQYVDAWKIGISTPDGKMDLQKIVEISNISLATSGDYRNYFEVNQIRYSHTIDPRTGYSIKHKLASVTVIANDCMSADGYATAIDVMGADEGLKFAKKMKLPVFMIVRDGAGFKEIMTEEFEKFLFVENEEVGKE